MVWAGGLISFTISAAMPSSWSDKPSFRRQPREAVLIAEQFLEEGADWYHIGGHGLAPFKALVTSLSGWSGLPFSPGKALAPGKVTRLVQHPVPFSLSPAFSSSAWVIRLFQPVLGVSRGWSSNRNQSHCGILLDLRTPVTPDVHETHVSDQQLAARPSFKSSPNLFCNWPSSAL